MENLNGIKKANTDYSIHELIAQRWSPRAFSDKKVEPEKLQRVFEAARWAPSAYNAQPWNFLIGYKGDEVWTNVFETLIDFNKQWVKTAPILALCVAKVKSEKGANPLAAYDCGQALYAICIQAEQEGLHVHQMSGFDAQKAAQILDVPEDYQVLTAFVIGYPGDLAQLPEDMQKMEKAARQRRKVKDFVFTGKFGQQADFL